MVPTPKQQQPPTFDQATRDYLSELIEDRLAEGETMETLADKVIPKIDKSTVSRWRKKLVTPDLSTACSAIRAWGGSMSVPFKRSGRTALATIIEYMDEHRDFEELFAALLESGNKDVLEKLQSDVGLYLEILKSK